MSVQFNCDMCGVEVNERGRAKGITLSAEQINKKADRFKIFFGEPSHIPGGKDDIYTSFDLCDPCLEIVRLFITKGGKV